MFKDLKVIIVEDSPLVQKQIALTFEEVGLNVIGKAQNGVEALMRCKKALPDLISIDVIMPEMHGIDLFREIRKQFPEVKCLFVTCLRSEQIKDAFPDEIEAFQFIEKPVTVDSLTAALKDLYDPPKARTEETAAEEAQGAS